MIARRSEPMGREEQGETKTKLTTLAAKLNRTQLNQPYLMVLIEYKKLLRVCQYRKDVINTFLDRVLGIF